ncbi:MAG TPA: hypothetical protein DCP62_05080 [Erysipelotrichaceae bacterium]|nr:MAG: hypothetical protein A2Y19_02055 [Firmicutes bacterium GWE2_51_13]HAM63030.1 hypothetical protein [Erysipelotrichaceae bacterium]HBZ42200.1 hypothetical protein [Erysipelotrichaceae bacterium]
MIQSLIVSFSVVAPLCLLVFLGMSLRKIQLIPASAWGSVNKLVFNLFLPALLFTNVIQSDLRSTFDPVLILFCFLGVMTVILVSMATVKKFCVDPKRQAVIVQGIFRSNFALFGIPVVAALYTDMSIMTLLIGTLVPIINIAAVLVLDHYRHRKTNLKDTLTTVFTNPLILATLSGLVVYLLRIPVPSFMVKTLTELSKVASPLALVTLGAMFEFSSLKSNAKAILSVVLCRLVLVPLPLIFIALSLGYREVALVSILALFASPTAVSSFSMTIAMDADHELAAQIIMASTLMAMVTIFIWLTLFAQLGVL